MSTIADLAALVIIPTLVPSPPAPAQLLIIHALSFALIALVLDNHRHHHHPSLLSAVQECIRLLAYTAPENVRLLPQFTSRLVGNNNNNNTTDTANATAAQTNCPLAPYTVRIASYSPLVVHLEGFVLPSEAERIIDLANPNFSPSMVHSSTGENVPSANRTSSSAFLPDDDPIIRCVMRRAASFQGELSTTLIETPQAVRYKEGQEYRHHYDWGVALPDDPYDRLSTFFVTLKADCGEMGCGTHFPHLNRDLEAESKRWCRLVDCNDSRGSNGTVFKALPGSAVFWRNMNDYDEGDYRVLHAGLPVHEGEKIGMNIWTREG